MEHADFVQAYQSGSLVLGVNRPGSRRLFTDHSMQELAELTGEDLHLEKLVITALLLVSLLLLLLSVGLVVITYGWWSIGVGPIALALYVLYWMASPRGTSNGVSISVMFALGWVEVFSTIVLPTSAALCLAVFVSSLWANRMTYVLSTSFARAAVLRSPTAFSNLASILTIGGEARRDRA